MFKRILLAAAALAFAASAGAANPQWKDGTYVTSAKGIAAQVKVETVIKGGRIASVKVLEHQEMPDVAKLAIEGIPPKAIAAQSAKIDAVSKATLTSEAIIKALGKALDQAAAAAK